MNKYESIPKDIIIKLASMKKRELQLEYLGLTEKFNYNLSFITAQPITSAEQLYKAVDELLCLLDDAIPQAIREFLDYSEYDVYTHPTHGRKFWNEIALPKQTNVCFEMFLKLNDLDWKETSQSEVCYVIDLYDMNDNSLYFKTKPDANDFAGWIKCAPATLFKLTRKNGTFETQEEWNI